MRNRQQIQQQPLFTEHPQQDNQLIWKSHTGKKERWVFHYGSQWKNPGVLKHARRVRSD